MALIQALFRNFGYNSVQDVWSWAYDRLFRILLVILPFHVLFTVFFQEKIGIPFFTFYKELLLLGMAFALCVQIFKKKIQLRLERIDWLIIAYVGWMMFVTIFYPHPLTHLLYGGRYDFEFLFAFLLVRHGVSMLELRPMAYFRMFLISASVALVLGILVRWVFGEAILLHFGFSANLSNWMFGGSIPIYHGIDQANVRRFQGIFDGPNPAGFFILLYLGVLATYFRSAKQYHFLLSIWGMILVGVLLYTYSRSALLGFFGGLGVVILSYLPFIWKRHRSVLFWSIPFFLLILSIFALKFENTIHNIVFREWSTKWHFDRAITGIERAMDRPFWSWLASAGPAYRFVRQPEPNKSLYEGENKTEEDYYIPESWFIQQLVEGWILWLALFIAIIGRILIDLSRKNIFLMGSFFAMAIMNLVLHSYESSYISLLLFMLVSLTLYYDTSRVRTR